MTTTPLPSCICRLSAPWFRHYSMSILRHLLGDPRLPTTRWQALRMVKPALEAGSTLPERPKRWRRTQLGDQCEAPSRDVSRWHRFKELYYGTHLPGASAALVCCGTIDVPRAEGPSARRKGRGDAAQIKTDPSVSRWLATGGAATRRGTCSVGNSAFP